jgi:F0F1-type ATP synthase membrane subunit b/b'
MEHHLDMTYGVLIPYINFFLFLAAFYFFFRKPLKAYALGRREKFLAQSKEATKKLEESQRKFHALQQKFNSLEAELKSFDLQNEARAKDEAMQLVVEGERLATQIRNEIKKLAEEEVARAKVELRAEIVAAAKAEATKDLAGLSIQQKDTILRSRFAELSRINQ